MSLVGNTVISVRWLWDLWNLCSKVDDKLVYHDKNLIWWCLCHFQHHMRSQPGMLFSHLFDTVWNWCRLVSRGWVILPQLDQLVWDMTTQFYGLQTQCCFSLVWSLGLLGWAWRRDCCLGLQVMGGCSNLLQLHSISVTEGQFRRLLSCNHLLIILPHHSCHLIVFLCLHIFRCQYSHFGPKITHLDLCYCLCYSFYSKYFRLLTFIAHFHCSLVFSLMLVLVVQCIHSIHTIYHTCSYHSCILFIIGRRIMVYLCIFIGPSVQVCN